MDRKNNAVVAGAKQARAPWLLFTDADTVHLPGSLARALSEAKREGADLLSYSPEQVVETFSERAVMPVIFAELAAQYPLHKVREQNSDGRGRERSVHPRPTRSIRFSWRSCCRGCRNSGRCGSGPPVSRCRPPRLFPLRRRRRSNTHVPKLGATPRRLDEESSAFISSSRASCGRTAFFNG